jgi:purine-binding chemotaxis protein CheW
MVEARRRGKKTDGEPAGSAGAQDASAEPGQASGWVAREESLVFPADPDDDARAGARISLPPSGLASEILSMAEAALVSPLAVPKEGGSSGEETTAGTPRSHNISFFAPVREERKAVEPTEHLATFYLAGEEYGVDVRLVQEIIRISPITQVPRAPDFIKGVINLRGRIIPVVDLKRKLGIGVVDEGARQARIVVVRVRDRLIGLLVDGAAQVLKVRVAVIEAAPDEVVEIDTNYIRGVAKLDKRLIILMDLSKVLALELREADASYPA